MKEVTVNSSKRSYKVYMDNDLKKLYLAFKENKIKQGDKFIIVTDSKVYSIYERKIKDIMKNFHYNIFVMEEGEENKSYNTIEEIYSFLIENECDRNTVMIAFGGGIVGDITGYVAATYMRGLRYISIPTTLLSQVDSSVGGKVAYNFKNIKNVIGTFYDPVFVFISVGMLRTLDNKEFISGLCEVIKYGIINNENILNYIKLNIKGILELENDKLIHIVRECIKIKSDVVATDYKDTGYRNILNFGHTVAHGIEIDSKHRINHGLAVALGMLVAIKISESKLNLNHNIYDRLENLYKKIGIPTEYKVDNIDGFLYSINHDKKMENDKIRFTLLEDINKCIIKVDVDESEILDAINKSIGRSF
ncbi:MAG: 3-dehydroquinate synthase [Clostridium sp.]